MQNRASRGFTLVELMIVVVIIGVALSLVGPLTVQQLDNSRRNQEREQLNQSLQHWRFYAGQHARALVFELRGRELTVAADPKAASPEPGYLAIQHYEHLSFPEQRFTVNANGFWQAESIRWFEDVAGERRENAYQLVNRGVVADEN